MPDIYLMQNTIQEYAWGSKTLIPTLMNAPSPSENPQAEIWMGAHPKAPSKVIVEGEAVPLDEWISKNTETALGEKVSKKFNGALPFLFKALAAGAPLSIQAHPDAASAAAGFERENREGIPFDAPHRNYKDPHHKPECIVAVTPFWGLNGFRFKTDIFDVMDRLDLTDEKYMKPALDHLTGPGEHGGALKAFFNTMMTFSPERQKRILEKAVTQAEKRVDSSSDKLDEPAWLLRLARAYPGDIGVLSPLFLNLVLLSPGEAMFLDAGELHAYLSGLGMEIMANSDNVLRGGLTPKHMDIPELMKILTFNERSPVIKTPAAPVEGNAWESFYIPDRPFDEFQLSVIDAMEPKTYICRQSEEDGGFSGPEILFIAEGEITVVYDEGNETPPVSAGGSLFVPAGIEQYGIRGAGRVFRASVPPML